jgi:hypothetical protein
MDGITDHYIKEKRLRHYDRASSFFAIITMHIVRIKFKEVFLYDDS